MENNVPRHHSSKIIPLSIVAAACIVAAGLVGAARILAQRPIQMGSVASTVRVASALPAPPLSQETVEKQVHDQVLAKLDLQAFAYDGGVYKLTGVKVSEVSYLARDDIFTAILEWQWDSAMPEDGPHKESVILTNNGYNQYTGAVFMRASKNSNLQQADICVK